LVGVWTVRAIVELVRHGIAIAVGITCISRAIAIEVALRRVERRDAVIERVGDIVPVAVRGRAAAAFAAA
jgi:hypothetical protein